MLRKCATRVSPRSRGRGTLSMRLWSLHPSTLDRQGLVACWREALLAQAVLLGRTRGYTNHPQLHRFRDHPQPAAAIGAYLAGVHDESLVRGYRFDAGRIVHAPDATATPTAQDRVTPIEVTFGQLGFEWSHLRAKLFQRSPEFLETQTTIHDANGQLLPVHPLFTAVAGTIASWERV